MIATPRSISQDSPPKNLRQRRRPVGRAARSASRFPLQPLEPRTLLSVTFATADTFQLDATKGSSANAIAADAAGNVYAAGHANDSAGVSHLIIREKLSGASVWTTIYDALSVVNSASLAVDPHGDLYAGIEGGSAGWTIYEKRAGQTTFVIVDHLSTAHYPQLTTDASGDVFASGMLSEINSGSHWIVRKQTGGTGVFTTVDDFIGTLLMAQSTGVTVIDGTGPSAGVYAIGGGQTRLGFHTLVRKSTDGGATWSTAVDGVLNNSVVGIGHDLSGNFYVVGQADEQVITGYKGKNPIYTDTFHWMTRKSSDGGATWTTIDDWLLSSKNPSAVAKHITSDLAGNMYVVGWAEDDNGVDHSVVRTNTGGTWQTVDNFPSAASIDITVDSAGTLYTAGVVEVPAPSPLSQYWLIRSAATAPLAPTANIAQSAAMSASFVQAPASAPVAFATADTFQLASAKSSSATTVVADTAGNVYAAGSAVDSAGTGHFVIRQKAAGSAAWNVIFDTPGGSNWASLVVDPAGDVYAGNASSLSGQGWTIYERAAGQSTFAVVDHIAAQYPLLATDAAGDVYATGYMSESSVSHLITRKQTGGTGAFTTVDDFIGGFTSAYGEGVTVVGGTGPSAGVYANALVYAASGSHWLVRKSADGGATWSTVGDFTNNNLATIPYGIGHDATGNLYAVGQAIQQFVSGYKGKNPIYATSQNWITRKSADGGATWTISDDWLLSNSNPAAIAFDLASDLAGNMYVVGQATDDNGIGHSIVRTNAGGTWQTVDNVPYAAGKDITVDSAGNLYTASAGYTPATKTTPYYNTWLIRSAAGPAPLAPALATQATASSAATPTTLLSALPRIKTAAPATPHVAPKSSATATRVLADAPSNLRPVTLDDPLVSIFK